MVEITLEISIGALLLRIQGTIKKWEERALRGAEGSSSWSTLSMVTSPLGKGAQSSAWDMAINDRK